MADPETFARAADGSLAELDALLCAPNATAALNALEASGALATLLPEVHALIGFHRTSPLPHKDLWSHTLVVLERTAREPELRWIALCHDIGKVLTRAVGEDGRLGFHRHEAVGAGLFRAIAERLAMPAERAARIAFVIEHHARTNQFEPDWSDRALRRLIRDSGEHLPLMLAFSAADWTTRKATRAERIKANLAALHARIAAAQAEQPTKMSAAEREAARSQRQELAAALVDLIRESGRGPGAWVKDALAWIEAEQAAGRLEGASPRALAAVYIAHHGFGTSGQE